MSTIRENWNVLSQRSDNEDRYWLEQVKHFADEAAALGVEAHVEIWAAPFVIVGICDGRGFYLRERHSAYRVTISTDEHPDSDPWGADPTAPSIDIADGDVSELHDDERFSSAGALSIAVRAVRTALARNACDHRRIESESCCPSCGVRLDDAAHWRW